jgi:E3 ubiquitin-protein ligase RNF103
MALNVNRSQSLSTHIFLNTLGLSVKQLKRLLDNRGIAYDGIVEKKELIDLVDTSGGVSEEELVDSEEDINNNEDIIDDNINTNNNNNNKIETNGLYNENEVKSDYRFSCGTHFYEEVEDTKDSAWIVNVMPINGINLIDNKLWKQIVNKCNRFGIRTAIFDCALDPYLCQRKGWISSRLVLALPREGIKMKEDVLLMTYLIGQYTKLQQIIDWIHKQLATRVISIQSIEDLHQNWLQSQKDSINTINDIKLVFISSLATPPLILSALAIKFSGRIKFGLFRVDSKKKKSLIAKLDKRIPSYIIVLSDRHYIYGLKAGENIKYRSMELLLRTLKPEMNDLFLLSLLLTNISVGLYFFWMKCSKLWKHIIYWFMHFVKYNCILFLIWLIILTLYKFPLMEHLCTYGYYVCQYLATTRIATLIRYDLQHYYKIQFLLFAFISHGLLLGLIRRKLISSSTDDNDDHLVFRDWTPWESTLLSYILFRPITMTSFRSMANTSIDLNLEEGMELLIERLAVPNLWLQPELISTDYIKDLPVWSHQNDKCDQKDSELSESDDSSVTLESNNEMRTHSESETCTYTKSKLENAKTSQSINSSHIGSDHFDKECSSSSRTKIRPNSKVKLTSNGDKFEDRRQQKCQLNNNQKNSNETEGSDENSNKNRIPDGMMTCSECAICLEVYRKTQNICGLPCGHNYHQNCIMLWLYRDNHCCPTCRWPTYKQRPKLN